MNSLTHHWNAFRKNVFQLDGLDEHTFAYRNQAWRTYDFGRDR
jgi:hypothetical protein